MTIWEDTHLRRCVAPDVDPDWWVEPDIHQADFGEEGHVTYDSTYGRALKKSREDELRAKILCYDCPFLFECRELSWDEPAHVWGGMSAGERYRARISGAIAPLVQYKTPHKGGTQDKVKTLYLQGCSTDDIIATLHLSDSAVMYHIRAILAQAREYRERPTPTWAQQSPPPLSTKAKGAFRAANNYRSRLGRGDSSSSLPKSA